MTDIQTNQWYDKAETVVNSCKNDEQLTVALTYIELYLTQTKDVSGYTVLLRKFSKRKQELGL